MENILLFNRMIVATGIMDDDLANSLLKKASESPAAKYVRFFLEDKGGVKGTTLFAESIDLTKMFVDNPHEFMIQITSAEKAALTISR
jgi:hypothetical protein